MPTFRTLASLVCFFAMSHPLHADHWRQTADPMVLQSVDELMYIYGSHCQMGNPQACAQLQSIQQEAGWMLNADYDCKTTGNPQACGYAQNALAQLQQVYTQTTAALQSAPQPPMGDATGGYDPNQHVQNMQQIEQWGQQRLQWGQQQSAIADANHNAFMQTLRN